MTKYKIKYVERQMLDKYKCIDIIKETYVCGIVYETESIVCYKLDEFNTLTLGKETNLMTGEKYLLK